MKYYLLTVIFLMVNCLMYGATAKSVGYAVAEIVESDHLDTLTNYVSKEYDKNLSNVYLNDYQVFIIFYGKYVEFIF